MPISNHCKKKKKKVSLISCATIGPDSIATTEVLAHDNCLRGVVICKYNSVMSTSWDVVGVILTIVTYH